MKAKSSKYWSKLDKISSGDDGKEGANLENRIVVRHRDLGEIVAALMEYFDKAASAGEQVTEMLEAGRDQLDRSFKQLRSEYAFEFEFCFISLTYDCEFDLVL